MISRDVEKYTQKESLLQEDYDGDDQPSRRGKSTTISQAITLVVSVVISLVFGYFFGQIKDDGRVRFGLPSKPEHFFTQPTSLTL
jgi:hypothetical protein